MHNVGFELLYTEMNDYFFGKVVFLFVIACICFFVYYNARYREARARDLIKLARHLNLSYTENLDHGVSHCPVFHQGSHRRLLYTIYGDRNGRLLQAGDYEIQIANPQSQSIQFLAHPTAVRFSYVQLQQPGAIFEAVAMQPRLLTPDGVAIDTDNRSTHELSAALGGQLLVPDDSALAERYILHTEDPAYTRTMLTPNLIALMLAAPPCMVYLGAWGLVLVPGERLWSPHELIAAMDFADAFLNALPATAFHREID